MLGLDSFSLLEWYRYTPFSAEVPWDAVQPSSTNASGLEYKSRRGMSNTLHPEPHPAR